MIRIALLRGLQTGIFLLCVTLLCPEAFSAPRISVATPGTWPDFRRGSIEAMVVSGNFAYATLDFGTFVVVDVSDPLRPGTLGHCDLKGTGYGLATLGSYVFVASSSNGLQVLEITIPAHPKTVGEYDTGGAVATAVAVQGNRAFLLVAGVGLLALDITYQAHPVLLGTFPTTAWLRHVQVVGNLVYVDGPDRLYIINAADPAHMTQAGSYIIVSGPIIGATRVVGSYAFVAEKGLSILDVSNPANITRVANLPADWTGAAIAISGQRAAVAASDTGLILFDISDPMHPVQGPKTWTGEFPRAIELVADMAYVAISYSGIQVFDLSDTTQLQRIGGAGISGSARFVAVKGKQAFIADNEAGLEILDVSNPTVPVAIGNYYTGGSVNGVQTVDQTLYLSDLGGLSAMDVTDSAHPRLMGQVPGLGVLNAFRVQDGRAYLAANDGLEILDVTNPSNMMSVASWKPEGYGIVTGVSVAGHRAFLQLDVDPGKIWAVLDVADPSHPGFQRNIGEQNESWLGAVAGAGDFLLVANSTSGSRRLDIYDGRVAGLPAFVTNFPTRYSPGSITISGSHAFVSEVEVVQGQLRAGVEIIDTSNPPQFRSISFVASPDPVEPCLASGRLYLAGWAGGLRVVPSVPGLSLTMRIDSDPGFSLLLESATGLGPGSSWNPMLSTNSSSSPLWVTDENVPADARFYRVRQQ